MELFKYYKVRFDFITHLCGSTPADPELIKPWLEARKPTARAPGGKSIDEINEEVFASLATSEERQVNGLVFQRADWNGGGLVLRAATLRAHWKDCARVISTHTGKIEGEKSFAVKVKNCVYHEETDYWIPICRPNGSKVMEADGTKEKPIHVTDMRGRPMNALKLFEFVDPAMIEFKIKVLMGAVPLKDLETLFLFGGCHGYGGERSDGMGRYTFAISELKDGKEVKTDGNKNRTTDRATHDIGSEQRS